jgi:hypothetical protein
MITGLQRTKNSEMNHYQDISAHELTSDEHCLEKAKITKKRVNIIPVIH